MMSLSASSNDFLCDKANVLWLLGVQEFYVKCPAFLLLSEQAKTLSKYIKDHGLLDATKKAGCKGCSARKAARAQQQLIDNFALIFLRLNDTGRMDELQKLLVFVSKKRNIEFARVILSYVGRATNNVKRTVIVGRDNG